MRGPADPLRPDSRRQAARRAAALFAVFLVLGQLFMFHRLIWSGLRETPGDYVNHLLGQFVLEHEYLWLRGHPGHAALWDPPVYHPARGTLAYAESMLGVAPLYWLPRLAGLSPATAYQLWLLALPALSFAAAWLLFRRGFGFAPLPSALGAFLCSYGLSLGAQVNNPQLHTLFLTYLALYGLCRLIAADGPRPWWVALAGAALVAQLYACFYLGWMAALLLGATGLAMLTVPELRGRLLQTVRRNAVAAIATALVAALALAPLVVHSLAVVRELGWSNDPGGGQTLAQLRSWIYPGRRSVAYFWLARTGVFDDLAGEPEQRLFLGAATALCAALGLWHGRRDPWLRLTAVMAVVLVVVLTELPGGWSLWQGVRALVPGAGALRIVSRAGTLLLVPAAIGVAAFASRRRGPVAGALLALCVAEQPYSEYTFVKAEQQARVERFASALDPACRSVYVSVVPPPGGGAPHWIYEAEIMLAQTAAGVPTVNGGYTRFQPPGYGSLARNVVRGAEDRRRIEHDLASWRRRHGMTADDVCRVAVVPAR